MKNLKYFKESNFNLVPELQELCDSYLVNLIDDGFVTHASNRLDLYIIEIQQSNRDFFKWYDIRDYIIPFLTILNDVYNFKYFSGNKHPEAMVFEVEFPEAFKNFNVNQIIND